MLEIREELLHPMLSHFPIALLLLLAMTKAIELILEMGSKETKSIKLINLFLLYTAPIFAIITLFLGDNAFDIVKNDLCNLTGAYDHEDLAHMTLYFLIVAVLLQVVIQTKKWEKFQKLLNTALFLFILVTNFYLIQTAHTGGKLVYEQGAGVKRLMKPCQ